MLFSLLRRGALAALTLAAIAVWPAAVPAQPVQQAHITLELVAQGEALAGEPVYVALKETMEDGWHTYWINPGDAGEPSEIAWTLPAGWKAGPIEWPAPARIPYPPLMNYGYEHQVLLPVKVTPPASARAGDTVQLKAHVNYQVCADQCIPGMADLTVNLTIASGAPKLDPVNGPAITAALAAVPRPADFQASITAAGTALKLSAAGEGLKGADVSRAYFFPYEDAGIDYPALQGIEKGPEGLTLTLTALPGRKAGPVSGVLSLGDRAFEISAAEGTPLAGAAGAGTLPPVGDEAAGADPEPFNAVTLVLKILAAFAGGLILNLMPCVFPVLSMKAAQLSGHSEDHAGARKQGLAFLAGCVLTFLILAGALLAARAAGAAVGWGFQLQTPGVTAALSLLMLLVALNLSGVFEIGLSVQGAGQDLASRGGLIGAFFTGALAVVVAAPCTAPLMGPALAYALGQPPATALLVFAGLGAGFAAPFTLLAFAPPLLRLIPRPGAWMGVFKTILAFPMFGAAGWLAWVFSGQAGHVALGVMMIAALLIAFGAWLFGQGQNSFSAVRRWSLQLALPLALVAAALLLAPVAKTQARSSEAGPAAPAAGAIPREAWSAAKVASLRAEGKVVFVDFTADWCITCKVNEGTSLSSAGVAAAFTENNAAYLVADWTNRDEAIAKALAEHGRASVPLYLMYGPKGEPEVLPQMLTEGVVKAALTRAAAKV